MADTNDVDTIYRTQAQIEFARKMAESLLKSSQTAPSAEMMSVRGGWKTMAPQVLQAIAGAQYRDIAGSQDTNARNRAVPGHANDPNLPVTYGTPISRTQGGPADSSAAAMIDPSAPTSPSSPTSTPGSPVGADITTGSVPPAEKKSGISDVGGGLARFTTTNGVPFTVNNRHADRFQGAMNALEEAGYKIKPEQSGGYNKRNIAGTNIPSQHSYGDAIDVNWDDNPKGKKASDEYATIARAVAAQYGLTWGGEWRGKSYDPMHFEINKKIKWTKPAAAASADPNSPDMSGKSNLGGEPPKDIDNAPAGSPAAIAAATKVAALGAEKGPAGAEPPASGPTPPAVSGPAPDKIAGPRKPFQSEVAQPVKDNIIKIPGYEGPAPPMPPVMSQEDLRAQLMNAPVDQHSKIISDYHDSLKPVEVETTGGKLIGMPRADGPPKFTFIPSGKAEMGDLIPRANAPGASYDIATGGKLGENNTLSTSRVPVPGESGYETFKRGQATVEGEGAATKARIENLEKQRSEIVSRTGVIQEQRRGLAAMQSFSQGLDLTRSPTKDMILKAKSFADQFLPKGVADTIFDKTDLSGSELMEKINMAMAMSDTKSITSRGTNFDIITNMRTNAGLLQSKLGTELIADYHDQNHRVEQIIAREANKLGTHELHKLPGLIERIYKENPLVIRMPPDSKYPEGRTFYIRPTDNDEESKNFRDNLPSGAWYVNPQNKLMQKK